MYCRYFMTEQGCRKGDDCRFIHSCKEVRRRRGREQQGTGSQENNENEDRQPGNTDPRSRHSRSRYLKSSGGSSRSSNWRRPARDKEDGEFEPKLEDSDLLPSAAHSEFLQSDVTECVYDENKGSPQLLASDDVESATSRIKSLELVAEPGGHSKRSVGSCNVSNGGRPSRNKTKDRFQREFQDLHSLNRKKKIRARVNHDDREKEREVHIPCPNDKSDSSLPRKEFEANTKEKEYNEALTTKISSFQSDGNGDSGRQSNRNKYKLNANTKTCRYWMSNAFCYKGERCRYLHSSGREFSENNSEHDSNRQHSKTRPRKSKPNRNSTSRLDHNNSSRDKTTRNDHNNGQTISPSKLLNNQPDSSKELTASCESEAVFPDVSSETVGTSASCTPQPDSHTYTLLREREINQLKKRFMDIGCLQCVDEESGDSYRIIWHPTDPDWPFVVKDFNLNLHFPEAYPVEMFSARLEDSREFPEGFASYLSMEIVRWIDDRKQSRKNDDLAFRPFLKWFDRSLLNLFIKSAKQVKRDMEAKQAGFQFIPFGVSTMKHKSAPDHFKEKEEAPLEAPATQSDTTENNQEQKNDYTSDQQTKTVTGNDEMLCEEGKQANSMDFIEHTGDHLAMKEGLQDVASVDKRDKSVPKSSLPNFKTGTEVRFGFVGLSENVASLLSITVDLEIECRRCSTRSSLLIKGSRSSNLVCQKCRNLQKLDYQPSLIHQFSSTMGFLKPFGCKPFDLILVSSVFKICCLNCNKESEIKGLMFGQPRSHWCPVCHTKLEIEISGCKFIDHSPQLAEKQLKEVKTPRAKVPREPGIHEGQPLPDKGTCKHYKKSFRWLRFPCCGKCYPCDVCHDEKENHEMKFAGRMICGFCAKEQPFHMEKPCVSCGTNLKKGKSNHWEGGVGCRNQAKMARNDKQKFAGKNKTLSNKSTKQDARKTKKANLKEEQKS